MTQSAGVPDEHCSSDGCGPPSRPPSRPVGVLHHLRSHSRLARKSRARLDRWARDSSCPRHRRRRGGLCPHRRACRARAAHPTRTSRSGCGDTARLRWACAGSPTGSTPAERDARDGVSPLTSNAVLDTGGLVSVPIPSSIASICWRPRCPSRGTRGLRGGYCYCLSRPPHCHTFRPGLTPASAVN